MIHDFIVPLIVGMGIGAIIAFLSVSLGRSPVLERRRWKAIWANERWLKDVQEWIDETIELFRILRTDQEATEEQLRKHLTGRAHDD
jgi:hypothetical protein